MSNFFENLFGLETKKEWGDDPAEPVDVLAENPISHHVSASSGGVGIDEKLIIWADATDAEHVLLMLPKYINFLAGGVVTSLLEGKDKVYDPSIKGSVMVELVVILLHMVDRSALQCLGHEERSKFMDRIFKSTINDTAHLIGEMGFQEDEVKSLIEDWLNERQAEYSSFQVYLTEGSPPQEDDNSIFWRFAKNVAAVSKNEDNMKMPTLYFYFLPITMMIMELQVEKLFERWIILRKN